MSKVKITKEEEFNAFAIMDKPVLKKNIAIGKIGKSVKFKGIDISTGGGADIVFYSAISRMNPYFNFYFVGPNELNKLTEAEYDYMFPNHNVFSAFTPKKKLEEGYDTPLEYFKENNITIDFALFIIGLHADKSVQGLLIKEDVMKPYQLLTCFGKYSGPYVNFLNKTNVPWYSVSEDARYITLHCKDCLNHERLCFSQINAILKSHKHIPDMEHRIITKPMPWAYHNVDVVYSGFERMFMNGLSDTWREEIDIERKINSKVPCTIFSNGCGTSAIDVDGNNSSRYPVYKEWVIDNFKGTEYNNTMIYGNWDKQTYDREPRIQDKKMLDLQDEVKDTKYTLVYSQIPGFVTIKAWEMITLGILPFLHPDYDKFRLLGLPEYLYLNDKNDFVRKMRELDANPDMYRQLLNDCLDKITPEYLDGSAINNFIFTRIGEDLGFEYVPRDGVCSLFNRFTKNIKK